MKRTAVRCLAFLLLTVLPLSVVAEMPGIGRIKTTRGPVSILRDGKTRAAKAQDRIYQSDTILTGEDGAVGILLEDNTMISMGQSGRLALDAFTFAPARNEYELRLHMMHGTFVYQSGLLARLAPYAVELITPVGRLSMLKETNFKARFTD